MRIAIIGAGPSGLCAAKEIRQSNPAANVTVFESESRLGGTFARCHAHLTMVNNPMLVSFSDFPAAWTLPALKMWSAQEYVDYLERYAQKNGIEHLITFNSQILKARLSDGIWRLVIRQGSRESRLDFDYLVVCAGSNYMPSCPEIPGHTDFDGEIVHASSVKNPALFKGRRVLLMGLGETGSDLSELIAEHSAATHLSIRRGPGYLIPRYHDTRPTDLDTSRLYHSLPSGIDATRLGWLLRCKRRIERNRLRSPHDRAVQRRADELNHEWAETRSLGPFRRASTKSCGFIHAELKGRVRLHPAVTRLEKSAACFSDGSRCEVDVVIACTGYKQAFPFFDQALQGRLVSSNRLYNYMFLPGLHDKLAFVGYVRPAVGTVPALTELQSRLLARFLQGELVLPPADEMHAAIQVQQQMAKTQFPADFERVGHLVDYYGLLKSLATQLGVMPRQWTLLVCAPRVWFLSLIHI